MTDGKKFLIVCDKNPCTSFGRLTSDVSASLQMAGYSTKSVWLLASTVLPNGIPDGDIVACSRNVYTGFFSFKKSLGRILKQEKPDAVIFIRPEIGYLVPVVRKAAPEARMITIVHDTFAETLYPYSLKFFLFKKFFVAPITDSDVFIYDSEYTKTEADRYYGKPKLSSAVVRCPIRSNVFFPAGRISQEDRKVFWKGQGVDGFRGVCLNVSLDEPRKNLKTFFKVASLCPDVAFVRVGRLRKETQKNLDTMGLKNVFHFQNIPDDLLVAFYRNADLMLYPSFLEGFGLPPIEAIACGTPAVAAETSAIAENLKGVVPLLKDPEDAEGYVAVLNRVLSGENIVDATAAKALLDNCTLEAFSKRLSGFIKTVI